MADLDPATDPLLLRLARIEQNDSGEMRRVLLELLDRDGGITARDWQSLAFTHDDVGAALRRNRQTLDAWNARNGRNVPAPRSGDDSEPLEDGTIRPED